jgi:hypothetical protein
MIVQDFDSTHVVETAADLDRILSIRFQDGTNIFYISTGTEINPVVNLYPCMTILVKGDLANIQYYPRAGHPGFTSYGKLKYLDPEQSTEFVMTKGGELIWIANECVITSSDFPRVAKEFLISPALPKSIEWFNLGD